MSRSPAPPLVHKIRCGRRLEALREQAVLSQKEVATTCGWSQNKVANIETAVSGVQAHDLELLLGLYEADAATRTECHRLADLGRAQLPRRKGMLRNRFEGSMRMKIDLEQSADAIHCHSSMLVPGLLQTDGCMRSLFRAHRPAPTHAEIDQFTSERRGRQAVLDNLDQRFWFILHEAALRSLANVDGSGAVLIDQVRHLLDVTDRPNVEVLVAPFRNGYYPGQTETYENHCYETDPAVQATYIERHDGGEIVHDEKSVSRFARLWLHQRDHAMNPAQTRVFLEDLTLRGGHS